MDQHKPVTVLSFHCPVTHILSPEIKDVPQMVIESRMVPRNNCTIFNLKE